MRLSLVAVGRLKAGPERDLVERYLSRSVAMAKPLGFSGPAMLEPVEGRARSSPERRRQEAHDIRDHTADSVLVVFDERGASLASDAFAARLGRWRDDGRGRAAFVIGGPDGLDETVRGGADLVLSFGRLTIPHQLVRILVAEQLYRALTILAGHPYHRGESEPG